MGYYREKLLRVNLSEGSVETKSIPEEYRRKYVGGWGLGLRMLMDEVPLGISPTAPENPMLFMTGPLTGAPLVPAATNLTVCTLNANTGYTAGRAHTHGWFGPYVKFAGYDGVLVTGRAEEPTYLWIDGPDGTVELRDATDVWGADTHDSEERIKDDVGNPEASVATIGPAGERQVFGALIENDKNHHASHSGVGVVMGSKNLKAIAVYGDDEPALADEDAFESVVTEWRGDLFEEETPKPSGTAAAGIRLGGHHREYVKHYTDGGMLVTKNLSEKGGSDFGEGMTDQTVTPKPCWKCPIACSYDVEVTDGPYEGYSSTLSGGVEGLEAGGTILGITEPGAVFRMTDHYDRYGLEATSIGCSLAVAFEAFDRGKIDESDTDGLVLDWGDEDAAMALLEKTVEKEGIGEVLAKGPKRAAHLLGVPDAAVHTKGAPINLHDWRKRWGTLLGQVVGGGAGWPAPGMSLRAEPSLGYEETDEPVNPRGKPKTVRESGNKKFWDDSTGVCWFGVWGVQDIIERTRTAIEAATGMTVEDDPMVVGERITTLERVFNVERGLTPADDYGDVGQRLLDPIPEGDEFSGVSFEPYIQGLVEEYYREMGWDVNTGRPYKSTLERLDIGEFADRIW
jgi:aldehyde:ferredoxin oxidoreductase